MRTAVIGVAIALMASACASGTTEADTPTTTVAPATTTTTVPPTTTAAPTTTTTVAPTTTTTVPEGIQTSRVVPGENADVDAIVEAYNVVFDSTTTFEEKAAYMIDVAGLEETVTKYAAAGDDVGGITLRADEVGVDGSDAKVMYSFLFAGNAAYEDLEGDAVLTDTGWKITRDFFCNIMTYARVGCP